MYIPNLSSMSVVEYVDFLETRSLHMGIDAFDLNIEYGITMGIISDERYNLAKFELLKRWANVEFNR